MLTIKEILRSEVRPAFGCTEPAAVALAAAEACRLLPDRTELKSLHMTLSTNVYKNGMFVGVPNSQGRWGNTVAAALGAAGGDAAKDLEALKACGTEDLRRAQHWMDEGRITVSCDFGRRGIYIRAEAHGAEHHGLCVIEGTHTRRVLLQQDDTTVQQLDANDSGEEVGQTLRKQPFEWLYELVEHADDEDLQYVLDGVEMNLLASWAGLDLDPTAQRWLNQLDEGESSLGQRLRIHCCAASDARMAGLNVPVMSSFGSGNQGIVATLPFHFAARSWGIEHQAEAKAVVLSHLVSGYLKSHLGKLSAFCNCTIAAAAGTTAGLVYLMGGSRDQIQLGIQTMLSNTAGLICDGAKSNCSFKVGIGAYEGFLTAQLAAADRGVRPPEGIVSRKLEQTIAHLKELNVPCTDRLIIGLMEETAGGSPSEAKPRCAGLRIHEAPQAGGREEGTGSAQQP